MVGLEMNLFLFNGYISNRVSIGGSVGKNVASIWLM